jgi:predicted nucleotidyltransferase
MKRIEDIVSALRRAKPELTQRFGVRSLAIFGSYARGEQREDSDVDVLVDVDPSVGLRFVDLAERVEAIVGVRTDVVSRRAIKPRAWRLIERELIDVG